jgi:hypothetical protein
MTERDPVAEWMRALARRNRGGLRPIDMLDAPSEHAKAIAMRTTAFDRTATDLSRTRLMSGDEIKRRFNWRIDVGDTIRTLQRHNKRLRAAFGVDWVDATNMVIGESQRRGIPASTMARALTARLAAQGSNG